MFLSIGRLNGDLSEGLPRFLSIFPSVNRPIKSVVKSLRPIQLCIQKRKKESNFLKNMRLGVKKSIFMTTQISPNFLV